MHFILFAVTTAQSALFFLLVIQIFGFISHDKQISQTPIFDLCNLDSQFV